MDWDILDSTVDFTDPRGYRYVGISDSWKKLCLDLPCSKRVQVPPVYKERHLATTIDGTPVVIQAWRGNCPKAFRHMPGGIGGEVGIYRQIPGKKIPKVLQIPRIDEFPKVARPLVKKVVSKVIKELVEVVESDVDLWWPFPELEAQIDMTLLHPDRDEVLFHADPSEPVGGYWMSRWMNYGSYEDYKKQRKVPEHAYQYRMEFGVKGKRFRWDAVRSPIREA